MNQSSVQMDKYVLGIDRNSTTYLKVGKIINITRDESGIEKIEIEFFGAMKGPWGLDEQFYKIKCDIYDFQNQFKILKFEE